MKVYQLGLGLVIAAAAGCVSGNTSGDSAALSIGAALPFTGESATIGQNLERAMLLAVDDVNRAVGAGARKLRLEIRDSNSGSERGLDALIDLLYQVKVRYLIGPEENHLATEIVPDIKGLDVLNVLPGYASPSIEHVGFHGGAWLRLPPTTLAFGCGLSQLAHTLETGMANIIVTQDDYNQAVSSEFAAEFIFDGGRLLPSVTVKSGAQSYVSSVMKAAGAVVDRTLLFTDPKTASKVVTESMVIGRTDGWLLGPMLNTPGFLHNMPSDALNGSWGVSPTQSLPDECEQVEESYSGPLHCVHDNADAFAAHFADRWEGELPFPAAYFYYDAVVLLAMGLAYADARGIVEPSAARLHALILELNQATEQGRWNDLEHTFAKLSQGIPLAYLGSATTYQFDQYGAATHILFDSWTVDSFSYVSGGTLRAQCTRKQQ
jgi:ABC-type branched-subunit amino acid transport system substrate-binding protein